MAFDFSKLKPRLSETFVVEVKARQKYLLEGRLYNVLTRADKREADALWLSIQTAWNEAKKEADARGVSLHTYELKPKLYPVPMLYGEPDGWPIVIDEMVDDEGRPHHEVDPGDKYATPEAIIDAMNERAEYQLWRNRKAMVEAFGEWTPGIWRGQPNKHAVKTRS